MTTTAPSQEEQDTRGYVELRYATDPIQAFNLFIKRNCPDNYTHFIDSDDNEAEFVRRIIQAHTDQQVARAVIEARIEELAHVYPSVFDEVATNLKPVHKGAYHTVNQRIVVLTAQLKSLSEGKS